MYNMKLVCTFNVPQGFLVVVWLLMNFLDYKIEGNVSVLHISCSDVVSNFEIIFVMYSSYVEYGYNAIIFKSSVI